MMRRTLFSFAALGMMTLLLGRSAVASAAVRQGLALCAGSLLPALFPFLVTVSFAVNAGLFHTLHTLGIPAGTVVFLLGALGGYPLGGRTVGESYRAGFLTKGEAQRLLACCNNAGPAFILTVVGQGVFHSRTAGLCLWIIHLSTALLMLLLLPCAARSDTGEAAVPMPPAAAFITAVKSAAETMVHLSGFVVLFSVITVLPGRLPPLAAGFLELTVGITALSPHRTHFAMAAAFLGWGGVSVHCQTAAALSDTDLSLRYYLPGKALHGLLSAVFAWLLYPLLI